LFFFFFFFLERRKKNQINKILIKEPEKNYLNDAMKLVKFLEEKKEEDKEFFFALDHNAEGTISKIFWMNKKQKELLKLFGDVLLMDTTAKYSFFFSYLSNSNSFK